MSELKVLEAEQACAKLIAQYANWNDAHEWERVSNLFAEEGRLARPSAPDDWIEGRSAILDAFLARPARKTRHICSNVVIDVLDAQNAIGESAMVLFVDGSPPKVGSFQDRFQRTECGWRFIERRGTLLF